MMLLFILMVLCLFSCEQAETPDQDLFRLNTSHLDHLYQKIEVPQQGTMGIIHIYSEYPDYTWVGDTDEGISCVDDVARAAIFYLRNYRSTAQPSQLKKGIELLNFILHMQAANGYFYNFIFSDLSINRDGITSKPQPNWWSWRAFWAFGEAIEMLDPEHPICQKITLSRHKLIDAIIKDFDPELVDSFQIISGLNIPRWLPAESAADQAALLILGLVKSDDYRIKSTRIILQRLIDGIKKMQVNNGEAFPHGAFLSWQNTWHAYGNSQSYALLTASSSYQDSSALSAALREIDYFYNELIENTFSHFQVKKTSSNFEAYNTALYPQIAYNIRPIIWACIEAGKITGEDKYSLMAHKMSQWFVGNNIAGTVMYDSGSGRCFDGINGEGKINKNSGAESTIEALLAIQELSTIAKL